MDNKIKTRHESARASLNKAVEGNVETDKSVEKTPILDTVALRIEELQKGLMYSCILSNNRRVQYIGNLTIKWYSPDEDVYKTSEVSDYQLKPLEIGANG